MKHIFSQTLILAIASLFVASCTQTTGTKIQGSKSSQSGEIATKRIQVTTRYKKDTQERPEHNPDASCSIKKGEVVQLQTPLKISSDGYHVIAKLAPGFKIPNCNLKEGYFFGEHLYGADWAQKKADEGYTAKTVSSSQPQGGSSISGDYSSSLGNRLANAAVSEITFTRGNCYRDVSYAMISAGIITDAEFGSWGIDGRYSQHAYQFAEWANRNPQYLARMNLKRSYLSPQQAPVGSIIVYNPGVCGVSYDSGHIEIVTRKGQEAYHSLISNLPATCYESGVYVYIPVQ